MGLDLPNAKSMACACLSTFCSIEFFNRTPYMLYDLDEMDELFSVVDYRRNDLVGSTSEVSSHY
jgi:hypothetical protein